MAEVSLAIKAADGGAHDKDATVPEDPGDEIACHSDSNSSSSHEGDESDEPEPPALHKKLLAIAEGGQPTKPATSEEFNSLLVEKRSEINAQDSTGKTALHVAIEHGLDAEAQTLIQNEADIGIGDNEGQQPLYHACVEGNTELVKLLLSKSAIVNAASNNGETPLAAACRNGHTEIVNILLDEKANTKTADEEKWTPLHWASWDNHKEIVNHLLDEDTSNINAIETNENWTPINAAAYRGHEEVVSLLLEENADLYTPDYSNWTPLLTATRMQHPEIVRTILRYKTGWKEDYLEIRDDGGNTPLHVASNKGYYEIASQLVGAGANCNATDGQGMTPLHLASFGNHYKIIALLVLKAPVLGIDIDAKANDGRTSLHLASLQGNELIVKALIQGKVSIDATDDADMTPLHLASGANVEDRCLSDPDPASPGPSGDDGPDWEKRNVEAKSGRHLAVVELLLRNEANPRLKAANGDIALHRAAAIGDNERIDILLKNMKSEDFSWENWKDSPVKSALGGDDPQAAMESLLAKQEVKKAPFWKEGGRNQVMEEAVKCARPRGLLDLIFRELSKDALNPPTGCQDWGSIQWAAHERLPDVLSGLINKSEPIENVDEMVHEALKITANSISSNELQSESSCELLVQVMWILITSSERTPKNTDSVKEAYDVVRKNTLPTKHEAANPLSKEEMRIRDKLFKTTADLKEFTGTNRRKNFILTKGSDRLNKVQEKNLFQLENLARNFEGYAGKDTEPHTSHKFKSIAILSTLQDILKDPPFAQISQTHKDKVDYSPPVPAPDHQKIVKEAEATVVGFFKGKSESGRIRRSRSLQEIIYDLGPTDVMGTAIRDLITMTRSGSMHFNSKLYAKENLKLKWVHLPSTNDLLTRIMSYEGYLAREYYEVRSFFRDSWVEVPDKESRSRMMRPRSVTRASEKTNDGKSGESASSDLGKDIEREKVNAEREREGVEQKNENNTKQAQAAAAGSLKDKQKVYDDWNSDSRDTVKRSHGFVPASAIYMPYLEYSTHCRDWNDTKSGDFKQAHEHYEELLQKYKGKGKQQHGSPTLDEWYYQFSQEDSDAKDNQNTRNESQVVSKYLQESPEIKEASGTRDRNQWTVVRVNQLWIWTISKDWIITATSSPFTNSPDTLVEEVLNQLSKQAEYGGSRAQPVLASELAPVIIDHCIGLYEKRPNDAGRISIGQTFSHYINRIGRNETTLFDDFRALSPDEHHKKNANDKLDGHSPVGKSRETNYQPMAESTAATAISTHGQTRETTQQSHGQDISSAIQKAKDLYCDIKDARDELNILKSVAQYQQIVQRGLAEKGVDESRFSSTYVVKDVKELDSIAERIQSAINTTLSLQQSEVANRQATEATRQGKTVMTFTFATVLFLPLSFLSSLFALDVASFQEAPAWAFYIIFFVSIGISAILGFSVFYWEDTRHFKKEFMTSPANALEQLFKPASNPLTMPKASDSGNNETGRAIKSLRIVSKMEDWGQKLINRARGHGRKNDIDDIENSSAVLRG
ncbi:Ankyrin-3 [Fusarium oxysporum f. sp. cubense]|uniref:Ankyrin-3 n=1 Tax=Fusarium oxysporum f. sp. cubense TaxID=61366 RepID=A0A559L5Y2_FUSOC|nr:Ankyrin-3 [Fusarium oxysporum f. sp. cubense]